MNAKRFLIGSFGASIVYFLLGAFFYGVLFTNMYPGSEGENMIFVYLGCLSYTALLAYIFLQWAQITNVMTGLKAGLIIGLLYGLSVNFFMYSGQAVDYTKIMTDVVINGMMSAIAGGALAWILSKV